MMPTVDLLSYLIENIRSKLPDSIDWNKLVRCVALHVTKVKNQGRTLSGLIRSSDPLASSELEALYEILEHHAYFTNDLWRGFCWYVSKGTLNPRWSAFGQNDADLLSSVLTVEEMEESKKLLDRIAVDWTTRPEVLTKVLKDILPFIKMCAAKLGVLSEMVGKKDLIQQINYIVIRDVMRNNSRISTPEMMKTWAMTYASQAVKEIREYTMASVRGWDKREDRPQPTVFPKTPRKDFSEFDDCFTYVGLAGYSDESSGDREMEANVLVGELKRDATPEINRYLTAFLDDAPEFHQWRKEEGKETSIRSGIAGSRICSVSKDAMEWAGVSAIAIRRYLEKELPELQENRRPMTAA